MVPPSPSAAPRERPVGEPLDPHDLLHVAEALAHGADRERLLPAVVDAAARATGEDALLALRGPDGLRVAAASPRLSRLVGTLLPADNRPWARGLQERRPVLVRGGPLAPGAAGADGAGAVAAAALRGRDGAAVGVLAVLAAAEQRPGRAALERLDRVAGLVGAAVADACAQERERRRTAALDRLVALVARLATVADRAELLAAACDGARGLLGASRCRVLLTADADGTLRPAARSPDGAGDEPADARPGATLTARLRTAAGTEGVLAVDREAAFDGHERAMLETVAAQLAVALGTAETLERLTEEHLVRELFAAIADGHGAGVAARARSARVDPDAPHVVAVVEPLDRSAGWPAAERIERRLRQRLPGVLCDAGPERVRALVPVGRADAGPDVVRLDAALDRLAREERAVVGRSSVQPGLGADRASLAEADAAARVARALAPDGGARAWEDLGVYRYLVGVGGELEPDVRHARAVRRLWEYDRKRGSELVRTLERYLADRSVVPTARALFIHPNTLRQRLERIEHLTALTVADEDLLSLELAIKLHRLRAAEADTPAG